MEKAVYSDGRRRCLACKEKKQKKAWEKELKEGLYGEEDLSENGLCLKIIVLIIINVITTQ